MSRKILMLNQEYPPIGGGAGYVTAQLIRHLSARGNSVDLVTMQYGRLPAFEEHGNVRIHRVRCIRRHSNVSSVFELATYLFSALRKAKALAKKNKYDFVYAHFIVPSGIIALYLKHRYGLNYLVHARGSDVMGYNPDRFRLMHRLIKPLNVMILRNASAVVAGSRYFAGLIERQYGRHNIHVLPNGFDGEKYEKVNKEKIILFAARLFPRKGAQYLLKALDGLPAGWRCVIVGDGPYRNQLEKMAGEVSAVVEFTGWLPKKELTAWYKKSTLFVFPSAAESFGMVLVEAMHYGNVVITLAGSACEEVTGDAGIVLSHPDVEALHREILALTGDPERIAALRQKSIARAEKYTWKNLIAEYIGVFDTCF